MKILTVQFSLDVQRWMAQYLLTRISVKILTLRYSLEMERRLTPPKSSTRISVKILNLRFSLDMERWLTSYNCQLESQCTFSIKV